VKKISTALIHKDHTLALLVTWPVCLVRAQVLLAALNVMLAINSTQKLVYVQTSTSAVMAVCVQGTTRSVRTCQEAMSVCVKKVSACQKALVSPYQKTLVPVVRTVGTRREIPQKTVLPIVRKMNYNTGSI